MEALRSIDSDSFEYYEHTRVKNLTFKAQGKHEGARAQVWNGVCKLIAVLNEYILHPKSGFHFNTKLEIRQKEIESTTRI